MALACRVPKLELRPGETRTFAVGCKCRASNQERGFQALLSTLSELIPRYLGDMRASVRVSVRDVSRSATTANILIGSLKALGLKAWTDNRPWCQFQLATKEIVFPRAYAALTATSLIPTNLLLSYIAGLLISWLPKIYLGNTQSNIAQLKLRLPLQNSSRKTQIETLLVQRGCISASHCMSRKFSQQLAADPRRLFSFAFWFAGENALMQATMSEGATEIVGRVLRFQG